MYCCVVLWPTMFCNTHLLWRSANCCPFELDVLHVRQIELSTWHVWHSLSHRSHALSESKRILQAVKSIHKIEYTTVINDSMIREKWAHLWNTSRWSDTWRGTRSCLVCGWCHWGSWCSSSWADRCIRDTSARIWYTFCRPSRQHSSESLLHDNFQSIACWL